MPGNWALQLRLKPIGIELELSMICPEWSCEPAELVAL